MQTLLNRYAGKISSFVPLMAPPGEGSNAAGGAGEAGNESGDGNDPQEPGGDDDEVEDDPELAGLFADDDDVKPDEFDFLSQGEAYQPTAEEQQATQELGIQVKQSIDDFALGNDLIPDDFDPSDPAQLRDVLSATHRQAIQSTMQMMIPIINHALGTTAKQLKHHFDSSAAGRGKQSEAVTQFKNLGLTDPGHISVAKTFYSQALKSTKGDAVKAAKATRRALSAINISTSGSPKGGGSSGNRQRAGGSGVLEGDAALDSLFGKSK